MNEETLDTSAQAAAAQEADNKVDKTPPTLSFRSMSRRNKFGVFVAGVVVAAEALLIGAAGGAFNSGEPSASPTPPQGYEMPVKPPETGSPKVEVRPLNNTAAPSSAPSSTNR